ncbi:MAG TPA: DUF354 domain-containing protein [Thermoplasmata archaeon]|jgi:predicted glycosyltransferase
MEKNRTIWLDLQNPSDVLFFKPVVSELQEFKFHTTIRDRAETVSLSRQYGIEGAVIGSHHTDRLRKYVGAMTRFAKLTIASKDFDVGFSFEGGLAVAVAKTKRRPSVLFCDNDLKLFHKKIYLQDMENWTKLRAEKIVIPSACFESFSAHTDAGRLLTFDGYKEDIYIADFKPDTSFMKNLPFNRFVVVRPEALDSGYVSAKKSLVPALLQMLRKENLNVIYLPREAYDFRPHHDPGIFVPPSALNGLDLCYSSDAVITGSGTLAREGACMGKTAVSFFPGERLLSVDKQLADEGRMLHSRDPTEIVSYVLSRKGGVARPDFAKSKKVKDQMLTGLRGVLSAFS